MNFLLSFYQLPRSPNYLFLARPFIRKTPFHIPFYIRPFPFVPPPEFYFFLSSAVPQNAQVVVSVCRPFDEVLLISLPL